MSDAATSLRVLIADDELLARRRLARLLGAMPGVTVCGECKDGDEVLARVREGGLDVVLLDIQMPGLSGIDAAQLCASAAAAAARDAPLVIFCTAHPDHAVDAFDAGAIDYLVKPIEPARLAKALERARVRAQQRRATVDSAPDKQRAAPRPDLLERLAIPTRQGIVLVDPLTISHAVLDGELVTIHTSAGDHLSDFSLQELQDKLPADRFERVHRRALLNLAEVARLEPVETGGYVAHTHRGATVEVSRQAARDLRKRLGLRKSTDEED